MTTVGVTGAAGFIGSRVVKRLLDEGYDVDAMDDFSNGQVDEVGGVEIREGDVGDVEDVSSLADADAVLHLAAVSGVDDCEEEPDRAYRDNVVGTDNVAWVCRRNETPLVFPCSMAIVGDPTDFPITRNHPRRPLNLYGLTKNAGEESVEVMARDGYPAHVFMKSNVYGSHVVDDTVVGKGTVINFFIDRARSGDPLTVYEPGTQARDFIHVKDVAEAYLASVEKLLDAEGTGRETFEIASGRSSSILEVANLVADAFEESEGERPEVKLVENPRAGEETLVEDFDVDVSRAREELGWEAEHTLEDAVRDMIRRGA